MRVGGRKIFFVEESVLYVHAANLIELSFYLDCEDLLARWADDSVTTVYHQFSLDWTRAIRVLEKNTLSNWKKQFTMSCLYSITFKDKTSSMRLVFFLYLQ